MNRVERAYLVEFLLQRLPKGIFVTKELDEYIALSTKSRKFFLVVHSDSAKILVYVDPLSLATMNPPVYLTHTIDFADPMMFEKCEQAIKDTIDKIGI